MIDLLLTRSGPLNVTPAVERYARQLRRSGFTGSMHGMELDYGEPRPRVDFVDALHTFRRPFQGTVRRIVALLGWQLFQVVTLVRLRPRVIQFCDVFSVFPSLLAKLLWRARLVFDIRDVVKLAASHHGRGAALFLGSIEALGALWSDAVVVVDQPLVDAMPRRVRQECFVIPNAPLQDLFTGPSFSGDGKVRVNLAGFISFRRNLAAWCGIRERNTNLILDLYGTIADEETRGILDRHGLADVVRVSHQEALERTRTCDAAALMYDPSIGINRFAAPNKYYEALMFGKPIICAEGMGLAAEVEKWDCGMVLPYGNEHALEDAVKRLSTPGERERLGANARRLFIEAYRGRGEREMTRLYSRLGILPQALPKE